MDLVQVVVSIFAVVGTTMLSIIAYFIVKYIKDTDLRDERQNTAIQTLNDTSKTLLAAVEVLKVKQQNYELYCDKNHQVVSHRLNAHSSKLNEHDREISGLKAKVG